MPSHYKAPSKTFCTKILIAFYSRFGVTCDDSSPVSLVDLLTEFISTGIDPTFGMVILLALKVLDLSLKSQTNDPVLESFFFNTDQRNWIFLYLEPPPL